MMLFHIYLKNNVVYVPAVVQLTTGAYLDVEPVAVEPVANADGLRLALLQTIARGNSTVSPPAKGKWPAPVLLQYARAKSWSDFARGASMWSIEQNETYRIIGYRKHPDGYWTPDAGETISFPLGSKVDLVIDRMIAALQDAARKQ